MFVAENMLKLTQQIKSYEGAMTQDGMATIQRWLMTCVAAMVLAAPAGYATARETKSTKLTTDDHVRAVLEEKDAHSLWLLMARSAMAKVGVGKTIMDVNIDTAQKLIDQWEKRGDYRSDAQRGLEALNLPRDWAAANARLIERFKKERPGAIAFETKYYYVLSTADPKVTQRLALRMDAIFRLYDQLFNFEEKIPYKCVIQYWKDENEYQASGAPPGSVAYFSPSSKELVGYNTQALKRTKHMDPYASMYHEGWHQYFDFYIPNAPRWFDEGFAEVFEATQMNRGRARLGRNAHQARYAAWLLKQGKLIPLRRLFKMNHREFMAQADVAYAQSYSFITFLMNFRTGNRQVQHAVRGFYKNYFWELHKGTDPVRAVDAVFGNVNLEVLEEMWKKSVQRQR